MMYFMYNINHLRELFHECIKKTFIYIIYKENNYFF